jgi:bifunctional DNA primase/polymerase-like protein
MSPPLQKLYAVFGAQVVFLPLPKGSKQPLIRKWQNITFTDTQKPAYQQALEACVARGGNIGVLLGPASDGLVSVDLDRDELVDPFIALCPKLASTTRSRGKRGCNFFLRIKAGTPYPNSQSSYALRDADGNKCGEWRCGGGQKGAQTVIFGVHPDGPLYQIQIENPPVELVFDADLKWFYPFDSPGPANASSTPGTASGSATGVNRKGNQQADDDAAREERTRKRETAAYQLARSIDAYYDQPRKEYLLHEGNERYQPLNETQFKRCLRFHRMSAETLDFRHYSQVDVVLRELQQKKYVDYAGALAGKERGYYFENGIPILVTYSPQLIIPKPGNWDTLSNLLSNLYWNPDEPHGDEQQHAFYGWVQVAFNALRARRWQPGQALAFAGPSDAGKSLTQRLITVILGGRSAKAALFLQQRTDFNGEMFEAEHLMLEDEAASTRYRDRLAFAAQLKQIAANQVQPCHPKQRQIINLCPWWRVTISLNDEPDRLLVLPPLGNDVADKLILLRASQAPMPMPAETPEQKIAFWKQLNDELPAFLHYLVNEYEIPADWRSTRFGIKEFHHPALLTALEELDPAMLLLELIDTANIWHQWDPVSQLWGTKVPWEGSALELRRVLSNNNTTQRDASNLLSYTNATGRYLNKLAKIRATRVKLTHTRTGDRYEIYP